MKVIVRFFARAKDLAGADTLIVEVPDGAAVRDLRRKLAVMFPAMAGLLERSAFGVDNEFAMDDERLSGDNDIALLPPVSGG